MKYVSDEFLTDLESYLVKKIKSPEPEIDISVIHFQTVTDIPFENHKITPETTIKDIIETKVESFQDKLFQIIRNKQIDEVKMYKKVNMSRQLFSKIKSEKGYHPTKNTVFLLALGMELTVDETFELLEKAGYAFSSSCKFDLIIQYFILHKNYNIYAINEVLDKYGLGIL